MQCRLQQPQNISLQTIEEPLAKPRKHRKLTIWLNAQQWKAICINKQLSYSKLIKKGNVTDYGKKNKKSNWCCTYSLVTWASVVNSVLPLASNHPCSTVLFLDRPMPLPYHPMQLGSCHVRPLCERTSINHDAHCWLIYLLTKLKGCLQSLHEAGGETVYLLENIATTSLQNESVTYIVVMITS